MPNDHTELPVGAIIVRPATPADAPVIVLESMKMETVLRAPFRAQVRECLVSVASAQALHAALPEADLWFWDVDDNEYLDYVGTWGPAPRLILSCCCEPVSPPDGLALAEALV